MYTYIFKLYTFLYGVRYVNLMAFEIIKSVFSFKTMELGMRSPKLLEK